MQKQTALITGAARGIGAAIAENFRDAGFEILAPSRSELELSDSDAVRAYGSGLQAIDVLVNNAGENVPKLLAEIQPSDLQRIIAVNVTAPFLLSRYIGVRMAEQGRGRIINVASVYAIVGREGRSMYTTTKAALNGLTRALAVELGPRNVLVNAVCPGFVDTELTRRNNTATQIEALCESIPLRRLASVEEIARLVYFLGSEQNSYITGTTIPVDGGFLCQ